MSKPKPIVHVEMPYRDGARVATFYNSAFGWKMQAMGAAMGDYVLAHATESDAQGRPVEPGQINAGFFPFKPDWPAQYPNAVIAVEDLRAAMTAVTKAGGQVLGEPMTIPGVGDYVSFTDTEGNRVAMLQPAAMSGS